MSWTEQNLMLHWRLMLVYKLMTELHSFLGMLSSLKMITVLLSEPNSMPYQREVLQSWMGSVRTMEVNLDIIVDVGTEEGEYVSVWHYTQLPYQSLCLITMVESVGQMEFISDDVVEAGIEGGNCVPDSTKLVASSEMVSISFVETDGKMEFVSENVVEDRSDGRKSVSDSTKFGSVLTDVVVPVVESDDGMESVSESVGEVTEKILLLLTVPNVTPCW